MSGGLKTNLKRGGFALLAAIGLLYATEIVDEVATRLGIGPRQLVPDVLLRPRPIPPEVNSRKEASFEGAGDGQSEGPARYRE